MPLFDSLSAGAQQAHRLNKLSTIPTTDDLKYLLDEAKKRRKIVDLPFENPHNRQNFVVRVQLGLNTAPPTWTFYMGDGAAAKPQWSRATEEVLMIQSKVKVESSRTDTGTSMPAMNYEPAPQQPKPGLNPLDNLVWDESNDLPPEPDPFMSNPSGAGHPGGSGGQPFMPGQQMPGNGENPFGNIPWGQPAAPTAAGDDEANPFGSLMGASGPAAPANYVSGIWTKPQMPGGPSASQTGVPAQPNLSASLTGVPAQPQPAYSEPEAAAPQYAETVAAQPQAPVLHSQSQALVTPAPPEMPPPPPPLPPPPPALPHGLPHNLAGITPSIPGSGGAYAASQSAHNMAAMPAASEPGAASGQGMAPASPTSAFTIVSQTPGAASGGAQASFTLAGFKRKLPEPFPLDWGVADSVGALLVDAQTGLTSITAFVFFLSRAWKRYQKDSIPFSVVVFEISIQYPDGQSMDLPAEALVPLSSRFASPLGPLDVIAHLEAGRFIVLLDSVDGVAVPQFCQRMHATLTGMPLLPDDTGHDLAVIAIGAASVPQTSNNPEVVIAAALESKDMCKQAHSPFTVFP